MNSPRTWWITADASSDDEGSPIKVEYPDVVSSAELTVMVKGWPSKAIDLADALRALGWRHVRIGWWFFR